MAWRKSKYKELGDSYSDYLPEYKIWRNMHERCEKKSSPMYRHPRDNARNRSDTIKIALYGDEYVLQDICNMFGLKRTTISEAIRLGRRSKEEALEFAFIRKFRRAE